MFKITKTWLALFCSAALGTTLAFAQAQPQPQDSALLDLLVKKGMVTDQEATALRADLAKQAADRTRTIISRHGQLETAMVFEGV